MWPISALRNWQHRRTKVRMLARYGRDLRARYDPAQTTDENRRHWGNADLLSAAAANAPDVRQALRSRSRYEIANNSIAHGIVNTLAKDVVGIGARLQLRTENAELNRVIEQRFTHWAARTHLARKLRTMRKAKAQDGEAFAVLFTNPKLKDPVKLDLRLVEAERVATPNFGIRPVNEEKAVDGIVLDEYGNPQEYHVLKRHPGAQDSTLTAFLEKDVIPADSMIHWFEADRPGQRRGIPELLSALRLFAYLRRWTLATLGAAEFAAALALIMKTAAPAGGEAAEVDPWVTMEFARDMIMFAPEGWEPTQLKAEHPTEAFAAFRRAVINEAGRAVSMPYNIAALDSAEYNFASGRLDHQEYFSEISVQRADLELIGTDVLLAAWLREALRVPGYRLSGYIDRPVWEHEWLWPARAEIDPRWARAQVDQVKAGLKTEAQYHAERGRDWEAQTEQKARERDARDAKKLPHPWQKGPAKKGAPK